MTINEDGKTFVVNKMEWHYLPDDPITERSEDTYMYFAFAYKTCDGDYHFYVQGAYLGDYIKDEDDEGNAILSDDDIYAWSESDVQPPRPLEEKKE